MKGNGMKNIKETKTFIYFGQYEMCYINIWYVFQIHIHSAVYKFWILTTVYVF